MKWQNYIKQTPQPMRPYIPGEDMSNILIQEGDVLEEGGMVAKNPKDETDRWYVSKKFFKDNYKLSK